MEGEGVVLEIRPYSNSCSIIKIFSKSNGRITTFLRNASRDLMPCNLISFKIRKRLSEHMGTISYEVTKEYGSFAIKSYNKHLLISSLREVLFFLIPEESPEEEIFLETIKVLENTINLDDFYESLASYASFELRLLSLSGFGLNFEKCALTGETGNLYFISPFSGRCSGFEAGLAFKDKLFKIPAIFGNMEAKDDLKEDLKNAFKITTHFLSKLPNFEKIFSRKMLLDKNL